MEARKMDCLRCGTPMRYRGEEEIQLGKENFFFGSLSNLLSGALDVVAYECPRCGKLEFFSPESKKRDTEIPQRACPNCGFTHDFDCHTRPKCGHVY